MTPNISDGNVIRQAEKFLTGSTPAGVDPLRSGMQDDGAPRIYLREWLELLGVDITDAAKVAGISQPYMSNIIAGRKPNVNVLYLLRISEHLGITINDLYRPLPKKAQLTQLTELSPKAREKIFNLQRKKA